MSSLDALIPLVIVGAVDHGKSTFIGRLLVDTQQLTPDRLEDLKAVSKELNQPVEYAHVTDQFQEEREANITIDTTQTRFQLNGRTYLLIDAPGHKEYLANMITGAARARHALLMLDVNEGIRAQTEKHADILKLLGIAHVAVMINKMDLAGYQEKIYNQHKALIEESLAAHGIRVAAIIPMAAYHGENVTQKSRKMPWYTGPTAMEFIGSCEDSALNAPLSRVRFPVQLMHEMEGVRIALGRLEEGTLRSDQTLTLFPSGQSVKVKRLRIHGHPDLKSVEAGISIGLEVDNPSALARGVILCEDRSQPPASMTADVFWASSQALKPGDEVTLECRTQAARCRITGLLDEETGKKIDHLDQGGLARVSGDLIEPILIQPHLQSDVFGRVVLNRAGETVGCGVVVELA